MATETISRIVDQLREALEAHWEEERIRCVRNEFLIHFSII